MSRLTRRLRRPLFTVSTAVLQVARSSLSHTVLCRLPQEFTASHAFITPEMVEVCAPMTSHRCAPSMVSRGSAHAMAIEVELCGEEGKRENSSGAAASHAAASSTIHSASAAAYTTVDHVDAFSRGRVLNYLKRMGVSSSQLPQGARSPFTTRPHPDATPGRELFTATLRLPLPPPHGSYVAEGVAETVKDAELLAAMHAERVCDALAVPLFRLPSMQQKYAENVRQSEGRYAPLPGDAIRPEGTPLPPPLRMVSAAAAMGATIDRHGQVAASGGEDGGSVMRERAVVAEAEIITEVRGAGSSSVVQEPPSTADRPAAAGLPLNEESAAVSSWLAAYRQVVWYPWEDPAAAAPSSSLAGSPFDPTENGAWQLTNVVSTRLPPTKFAVAFACILDAEAEERVRQHWKDRLGCGLEKHLTVTQVALSGSASRMHVAEISLALHEGDFPTSAQWQWAVETFGAIDQLQAKGKAQRKEVAIQLATMHAELLLDALGVPLYFRDPAKQQKHAAAAACFHRSSPSSSNPLPLLQPPQQLPLPLKQQMGEDFSLESLTTVSTHGRPFYKRTEGERIVLAQNSLNYCTCEAVEVNPPADLLEEAEALLSRWQRTILHSRYSDCFIITRMGDFYRASTLTPVPRAFGVRGGIGIGRSPAQAIALASLHAVDSLCLLGVPLFVEAAEQKAWMAKRKRMGRTTPEAFAACLQPRDWQPLEPPIFLDAQLQSFFASHSDAAETMAGRPACFHWVEALRARHATAAPPHHKSSNSSSGDARPAVFPPYLPAYLIEGSQARRLPHTDDFRAVLQLSVLQDCEVFGEGVTEEELIHIGNEVRTCVQNYLRQEYSDGGDGCSDWMAPPLLLPSVHITGYGRTGASVYSVAFLRLPSPSGGSRGGSAAEADVGITKKKKKKAKKLLSGVLTEAEAPPLSNTNNSGKEDAGRTSRRLVSVHIPPDPAPSPPPAAAPASPGDLPPHGLAIGVALKKKDAERACFLHAARILNDVYQEDVLARHRAGLPRQSLISSFDALQKKCFPSVADEPAKQQGKGAEIPRPSPKPLIHAGMMAHINSQRSSAPKNKPSLF